MITTISEHTVETNLINGGVAIDVGCLGWSFSRAMLDMGCSVYAFDIQEMTPPDGIAFFRQAVMNRNGHVSFDPNNPDPQATHVLSVGKEIIECIDINTIYRSLDGREIDVLKLDCEGSEYYILSDENFMPIPKQISYETHRHVFPELHEKMYPKCLENLNKYYVPIKHEMTNEHCAGLNFWDSLWIRKDLIK